METRDQLEYDRLERIETGKTFVRTKDTVWNWVDTDLNSTAWGIQKTAQDLSLFHGIWTYNIPQKIWHIYENSTMIANNDLSTKCVSNLGQMEMTSWTTIWDTTEMVSRRHPRYQPNRGHYFATAWYFPNPSAIWIRKIWFKSNWNWVYFKLEDWILYWVMENSVGLTKTVEIDLPAGTDLSAWNLLDIQYHWRGVWNYYFYFNLKLAGTITNLGGWTQVSIANPAMSVYYSCENTDGTEVELHYWCVDVTSEWGKKDWLAPVTCANELTTIDPQGVAVSIVNQPLIIMRIKETLYWLPNTRDSIIKRISCASDQKSVMKTWFTRDITAFWWVNFIDANFKDAVLWSSVEYIDWVWSLATELTFDITKAQKIIGMRVKADDTLMLNTASDVIDVFIEQWDYIVMTWEKEWGWNAKMFWNLELGEEV